MTDQSEPSKKQCAVTLDHLLWLSIWLLILANGAFQLAMCWGAW